MDSAKQIDHRAAVWLAKRKSGEWTEDDQAQFNAWLEASTAHRIAHLRLEIVWEESQRLKALAAGIPPGFGENNNWTIPFFDNRQLTSGGDLEINLAGDPNRAPAMVRPPHSKVKVFALAASILVALAAGIYFGANLYPKNSYRTPIGGIASVPLWDGSHITLNTDSKVYVTLSGKERRIDLTQGEAFFDVAKDPSRPFIVMAGGKRIVAIGTQFSVRREKGDVRVVVTEGAVRLENSSSEDGELLVAGTIAHTRDGAVLVQTEFLPQVEEVLSWRTGYLTFRDTPLSEAISEFNQYNEKKIIIRDSALAAVQLTGKFKATNYDAFVRLLEDGYSIQARRVGNAIALTR